MSDKIPSQNVMKSFQLFTPKPKVPLADGVDSGFSPSEIDRLRERFRPLAKKFRRFQRLGVELVCLVVVAGIGGVVYQIKTAFYVMAGALCAAVVLRLCQVYFIRLSCPGCGRDLEKKLGAFCPECGQHGEIRSRGWFRPMKCDACGMALGYRKGQRAFTIRACTHCGLPLDEKGI